MNKIKKLVADFGGLTCMSKIINVPISTIQSWKIKGKIPTWRHKIILEACKRKKIDFQPNDFYEVQND